MTNKKIIYRLSIIGILSIGFVTLLFLLSENQMRRNNAFIRRYVHHPVAKKFNLPIRYNSYYIAGYQKELLYLGNTTAPLHLLKVNLKTKDTQHIKIKLNKKDLPFRSVKVTLHPPYFFVMDGSVPCIFRGSIKTWKADLWMKGEAYFTKAIPIDSNKLFIKTISSKTSEAILGTIEKTDDFQIQLDSGLLEKQMDGVFCVDGAMMASNDKKELGYVYFYRNEFMMMDAGLKLLGRQKTIDTISKAQIQLSKRNDKGAVKMESPPLMVNKTATLYKDLMLIRSNRLGRYEDKDMLKQAAIIDLYNWKEQTYQFSFYLYNIHQKNAKEFKVYDNYLVALIGNSLSVYQIKPKYFKQNTIQKITGR